MGDIQDMEVALQELADFGKRAPASYDPKPARAYYKERRAIAVSSYIEDKGEIITFWRACARSTFSSGEINHELVYHSSCHCSGRRHT